MSAQGFVLSTREAAFNPNRIGGSMSNGNGTTQGIELLLERCRNEFRRPENTDYYSEDDYKEAERKFVKFCLHGHAD
jgi:hypothetical protein